RRSHCQNNLKQIGLAFLNHHDTQKHLPTGGWGWDWIGDPDRGYHRNQPGGWAYNILAFAEQEDLRKVGANAPDAATKNAALLRMIQVQVPIYICPSRRDFETSYPKDNWDIWNLGPQGSATINNIKVAKSDFAACSGDPTVPEANSGPSSLTVGDTSFSWTLASPPTGISFRRSEVTLKQITDGTSKTYMVGEKFLSPASYAGSSMDHGQVRDFGDNECAYTGWNRDNYRTSFNDPLGANTKLVFPQRDANLKVPPAGNRDLLYMTYSFGSIHDAGLHMVFCDGSLRTIDYAIDATVHRALGARCDGAPVDTS